MSNTLENREPRTDITGGVIREPSPELLQAQLRCQYCERPLTVNGRIIISKGGFDQNYQGRMHDGISTDGFWSSGGNYNAVGWLDGAYVTYWTQGPVGFVKVREHLPTCQCAESPEISSPICRFDTPQTIVGATRTNLGAAIEQVKIEELVDLRDILPDDFTGNCLFEIPPFIFRPDQWTRAFLRGLSKLDVDGKNLVEIGVGAGINPVYLLRTRKPNKVIGSDCDYDFSITRVAWRNVQRILKPEEYKGKFFIEPARDLANHWIQRGTADIVFGCLPQVPLPGNKHILDGDNSAHYYKRDHYDSDLHIFGLGLIHALLKQATDFLNKGQSVVLNLSGRPGKETLERLFENTGFRPNLLHEEIIAQLPTTSLQSLAAIEAANGHAFEFFADQEAKEPLNATQAEARRIRGEPVFHRIYVYQGIRS